MCSLSLSSSLSAAGCAAAALSAVGLVSLIAGQSSAVADLGCAVQQVARAHQRGQQRGRGAAAAVTEVAEEQLVGRLIVPAVARVQVVGCSGAQQVGSEGQGVEGGSGRGAGRAVEVHSGGRGGRGTD